MAEQEQQEAQEAEAQEISFLEQAIGATTQTERDRSTELLKTSTEQALEGVVTWDRNLTVTINKAIDQIDTAISKQLAAIMHAEKLQKLCEKDHSFGYVVMRRIANVAASRLLVTRLQLLDMFSHSSKEGSNA